MSLPVNSMQGLDSREPNHWRNLTLEPVPGERLFVDPTPTGLFTDRREPATRIQRRKARVYRTLAIGKGLARERAAYSYICMPRFWMYYNQYSHLGKDFFSVLPTIGKRPSLGSTSTNRAHCWYCDKSVPSLSRNIDCLIRPHAPIRPDKTRWASRNRPDQTPPRGQQPCKNPWAAERAAYTVMGYCTTLSPAPDVFMHLGLRACCAPFLPVGGRCPAPRYARYQ
ncbi:hypothetical protein J3E68DRAFT_239932 [Trichoderma sp. SZMC 28012]